jgi:hypothetical protein
VAGKHREGRVSKEFPAVRICRAARLASRVLSATLLAFCLYLLWQRDMLVREWYFAVLLIANTGFIWCQDQFGPADTRSGGEIDGEGHGCLMAGGGWFLLIYLPWLLLR